eukprot:gene14262-15771_t
MSRHSSSSSSFYRRDRKEDDPHREEKERLIKEAQREWGKGSVQKQEIEIAKEELIEMANQPFARTRDDKQLEDSLKSRIRSEDPFAQYFMEKEEKKRKYDVIEGGDHKSSSSSSSSKNTQRKSKPLYKGPNAIPNRFGIRPGYRWDGVDRGNGYEQKVQLAISEKTAFNEEHYKWATADM